MYDNLFTKGLSVKNLKVCESQKALTQAISLSV